MNIIKSEMGKIFGGYTDIPWELGGGFKKGNGNSFLFSLRENSNFVKLNCMNKEKEVKHISNCLCHFGGDGKGFRLWKGCDVAKEGFSALGDNDIYELPEGIQKGSE